MAIARDQRIISGDSHFVEPPDLFKTRLPRRFRDQAPTTWIGELSDGRQGEFFIVENMEPAAVAGICRAGASDWVEATREGYAGAPKSVWDPAERLKEQDRDGIAAEVLYPSWGMFLFCLDDDALREACFSVFNDWAGEYVKHDRSRMKGFGICDLANVENGVRELHRIAELGLSGAMITGAPEDGRPYSSPEYDPFWMAAEELGLPLAVHILTGRQGKGSMKSWALSKDRPDPSPVIDYITTVVSELQKSLSHLIWGGVFERHRGLRFILAETDIGWLPHFIYRCEHFGSPHLKTFGLTRDAMEIFRNFATVQFEADSLKWVSSLIGSDRFMWSTDYPHFDCPFPNSRKFAQSFFDGFSPDASAMILEGTAAKLFGFDAPGLELRGIDNKRSENREEGT